MSEDHEQTGEAQPGPEATEAARELAAANMVDLEQIQGTGADGKITKADVEERLAATGTPTGDAATVEVSGDIADVQVSEAGHAPKVWTGQAR